MGINMMTVYNSVKVIDMYRHFQLCLVTIQNTRVSKDLLLAKVVSQRFSIKKTINAINNYKIWLEYYLN